MSFLVKNYNFQLYGRHKTCKHLYPNIVSKYTTNTSSKYGKSKVTQLLDRFKGFFGKELTRKTKKFLFHADR